MAEATNQEKLDQLVSQMYKQDFWSGKDPKSIEARGRFIEQFLTYGIQVGDSNQVTNLLLFLKWYPAGLNNVYQQVLAGNAQIAALVEAIKALTAAGLPGAAAFDQEAFFTRMQGMLDASVQKGVDSFNSLTFTVTATPEEGKDNG